jgi:hypothetical protein
MKRWIFIAFVLSCGSSLHAQIAATLNSLRDGSNEIRIRNNGTVSLTAFAVGANVEDGVSDAPLVVYEDAVIDGAAPLLPGETCPKERSGPHSHPPISSSGKRRS